MMILVTKQDIDLSSFSISLSLQEWEAKAARAKDDYTKLVKEFEANGGSATDGKKRSKTSKKPAKKSKKKDESDDDESEDGSD